eukprot:gene8997-9931_t
MFSAVGLLFLIVLCSIDISFPWRTLVDQKYASVRRIMLHAAEDLSATSSGCRDQTKAMVGEDLVLDDLDGILLTMQSQSSGTGVDDLSDIELHRMEKMILSIDREIPTLHTLCIFLDALSRKREEELGRLPLHTRERVSLVVEKGGKNGVSVSRLLAVLRKVGFSSTDLTFGAQDRLWYLFLHDSGGDFVQNLHDLAKLESDMQRLPDSLRNRFWPLLSENISFLSAAQISIVVWSMSKVSISWSAVPLSLRRSLLQALVQRKEPLSAQNVANLLQGLARMKASWSKLDDLFKERVERDLPTAQMVKGHEAAYELSITRIIYSLGLLGATASSLPPSRLQDLLVCLAQVFPYCSPQGFSNSLYALARLTLSSKTIPLVLFDQIVATGLNDKSGLLYKLDGQAISNVFWALGTMHFQWKWNSDDQDPWSMFCSSLVKALSGRQSQLTNQGVSNTLLGFAKMQAPSDVVFSAIDADNLANRMDSMQQQSLLNIYWSFCEFERRPAEGLVQRAEELIVHLPDPLSGPALATVARCLDLRYMKDNYKATALCNRLIRDLSENRRLLSGRECSSILHGLARSGLHASDLPYPALTSLVQSVKATILAMTEQELGSTVWAMGELQLSLISSGPCYGLLDCVYEAIKKQCRSLRRPALVGILQGLGRKESLKWEDMPEDVRLCLLKSTINHLRSPTADLRLLSSLLQALGRLQLPLIHPLENTMMSYILSTLVQKCEEALLDDEYCHLYLGKNAAAALHGLALLLRRTNHAPQAALDYVVGVFPRCLPSMDAENMAMVWWALAHLQSPLESTASSPIAPSNNGTMHGSLLRLYPIAWISDLYYHSARVLGNMDSHDLSWTLWSMARLKLSFRDLSIPLQNIIVKRVEELLINSELRSADMGVVLWALISLQIDFQLLSIQARTSLLQAVDLCFQRQFS